DAAEFYRVDQGRAAVPGLELYPRLREPGNVLVSENFAALHGVREGETFSLQGPRGPIELRVLGRVVDYSWNRGTILMDRGQFRTLFDDPLVDVFDVYLRRDARAEEVEAVRETLLKRWGAEFGLVALTRGELRERIRELILRLYSIAYAQE